MNKRRDIFPDYNEVGAACLYRKEEKMIGKPQFYINVSQTLAVLGAVSVGMYYIHTLKKAEGLGKKQRIKWRIRQDLDSLRETFTKPFSHKQSWI